MSSNDKRLWFDELSNAGPNRMEYPIKVQKASVTSLVGRLTDGTQPNVSIAGPIQLCRYYMKCDRQLANVDRIA